MKLIQKNRILYIHDNLPVMRGMNSDSVDLIATDPPFNTKRQFNAPMGSRAAGQQFNDRWRWDEVTGEWQDLIATRHPAIKEIIEAAVVIEGGTVSGGIDTGRTKNSIAAFLVWMAPRLIEMKRILKPTGSIYLHCDATANSYLRLLMDAIFGRDNFRNEVIWSYRRWAGKARKYQSMHDTILFYGKGGDTTWNWPMEPKSAGTPQYKRYNRIDPKTGKMKTYSDKSVKVTETNMRDVWEISRLQSNSKERTGWKTQKPLKLYQRIIKASSNSDDLVLDPFCGCATTCVAAEMEGRRWIGIDIDPVAETETRNRLFEMSGLSQMSEYKESDVVVTVKKRPPRRTDITQGSDAEMRLSLWKKQGQRCANPYCSLADIKRTADLQLDHVIPKSRGGSDDVLNRIGLCGDCNRRKSTKAWGAFLDAERSKKPHPTVF